MKSNNGRQLLRWASALILVYLAGTFSFSAPETAMGEGRSLSKGNPVPGAIKIDRDFGKMPLSFIPNRGQMDARVDYYLQGKDKAIYFTSEGLTYILSGAIAEKRTPEKAALTKERLSMNPAEREPQSPRDQGRYAVKLDFVGANPNVRPSGEEKTEAVISYFKGKPEEWKTGLPTYSRIVYKDLWPGIDVAYFGTVDKMKYEFFVHPGADPSLIRMAYRGASAVEVNGEGRLEVRTPAGGFEDDRPVGFQEINGDNVDVSMRYLLEVQSEIARGPQGEETVSDSYVYGFEVGDYDRTKPLVLDPAVLVYSCLIGGTEWDSGEGLAVDSSGNAYITGFTYSLQDTFPIIGGPDVTYNGEGDAYVAKVNASGTLVYCGYIGGGWYADGYEYPDGGHAIAVDGSGNAYITGFTTSPETTFPVVVGPDLTHNGGRDAFVAKVNPSGTALVYCGYIGGASDEDGFGIAVDSLGNAYVAGGTYSSQASFPVIVGPDLTDNGIEDAFVAKVNASGTALVYCGYIGGSLYDYAYGIAVDGSGNAYVTGATTSSEATFPVIGGPDLTYNDGRDAFVAKVNATGTALVYCGYVGGADWDHGYGIAVDGTGNAYITGETYSTEATFPVIVGPDLTFNNNGIFKDDAFVAKVNASGKALVYCGYIGGSENDHGTGIAVDGTGNAYVTGETMSTEATFPVINGPDLTADGFQDAFVAKVNPSGTALVYCGYIDDGVGYNYYGGGIDVDGTGNAYVTGRKYIYGREHDAFVAKISYDESSATLAVTSPNGGESWPEGSSHNITWTSTGTIANVKLEYSTNNGTNWTTIVASTPNDGSYAWTIPNTLSTNCLVRVSDVSTAAVNDVSNAVFSIIAAPAGPITVTSPNGGENWLLGSSHPITWTSTGTIANVKIEYSTNNGTAWTTINASTPNDGIHYWISGSPTDAALNTLSTTCLVRVSDAAAAAVSDMSNAVFTISACGAITGTVTDLSGTPIEGVSAQAYDLNNVPVATRYTNASGQYWIAGLRAGSYKVVFFNDYTQNYLYEWYNDQRTFNTAGVVAVTLNNTTANINAQLGPGGIISGRVTDESGAGLAGVSVTAWLGDGLYGYWEAESDANGDYQVKGLPAGNCKLLYQLSGYPPKFYGNSYSFEQSTAVPVSLGAETSGINAILEKGGQISGTVTDGSGNPVSGIKIITYDATSNYHMRLIGNDLTAADGTYSVLVRAGRTKVLFDASAKPAGGLCSQFYNNQKSFGTAGSVNVVKDQTTLNINAVLAAGGGTMTVQVRNGLGQGVYAVVYLYNTVTETRMKPGVATDANGYVEIKGLLPGNYKVKIYDGNGELGRYYTEWHNNALTFENAAPVTVTEGGTTALAVVLGEAAPVAPEINLKQGATNIATGGTFAFGSRIVGTDTDTVFTIQNAGSANLTLTGLPLMVGGTNANQFSIIVQPTSPIAAAGSKTFTVRFHPTSSGNKTAQLSIANNDGNENPYVLNLTGTGNVVGGIPTIGLSKTSFNFGTERNGTPTPAETVVISNTGTGTLTWTAAPSANWLGVTPGSGTGAGVMTISVSRTDMTAGQYTGTVAITAPGATNSPRTITVNLIVKAAGSDSPPFGNFATPANGSTVASSVPVTGWVLDDIGMKSLKIYRGTNTSNRIYIGDAMFVEGARPDVKNAYPTYPQNTKAGWGYMLLTNFLPNSGNGTFTLLAYAKDTGDHEVLLGSKTITCDNAHAVKPFGAIDTPSQGGTASGSNYVNFGWALTPQPNSINSNGTTIWVYVDGVPLGHPTYNQYRKDIATLFPGYANSNGAVGYYYLNTALYTDAVHTIVWSVADSGGNMDGIGSRYFTIQNAASGSGEGETTGVEAARGSSVDQKTGERIEIEKIRGDSEPSDGGIASRDRAVSDRLQAKGIRSAAEVSRIPEDGRTPAFIRRGYRDDQPAETVFPEADGLIRITIPEVSRVAVYLNEEETGERVEETAERGRRILKKSASPDARYEVYQIVGDESRPLPIGASFDSRDGVFFWQLGPGFLGEFQFVIVDSESKTRKTIKITIGDRSLALSPIYQPDL